MNSYPFFLSTSAMLAAKDIIPEAGNLKQSSNESKERAMQCREAISNDNNTSLSDKHWGQHLALQSIKYGGGCCSELTNLILMLFEHEHIPKSKGLSITSFEIAGSASSLQTSFNLDEEGDHMFCVMHNTKDSFKDKMDFYLFIKNISVGAVFIDAWLNKCEEQVKNRQTLFRNLYNKIEKDAFLRKTFSGYVKPVRTVNLGDPKNIKPLYCKLREETSFLRSSFSFHLSEQLRYPENMQFRKYFSRQLLLSMKSRVSVNGSFNKAFVRGDTEYTKSHS